MSRRSLALLLAVVVLLGAGIAWIVGVVGLDAGVVEVGFPSEERSERVELPSLTPSPDALHAHESGVGAPSTETATPRPLRVSAAGSPAEAELLTAIWVDGRVVLPLGTPADEHVEILADGRPFESRTLHRSPIAADGTFRVAFSKETGAGTLVLEARYLYLDHPRTLWLSAGTEEIVLEPKIGGCIRGRAVLPPGALAMRASVVGCEIRATGRLSGESRFAALEVPSATRDARIDPDLGFEIEGVPAGFRYSLTVHPPGMAESTRRDVEVEAGRVVALDLDLQLGATLSGIVVDPSGKCAPGARVIVREPRREDVFNAVEKPIQRATGADGRFELRDLTPGATEIFASSNDWADSLPMSLDLQSGQVMAELTLQLHPFGRIVGQVIDPEGRPQGNISIWAWGRRSRAHRSASSDRAGHFEIESLSPDTYSLALENDSLRNTFEGLGSEARTTVELKGGETARVVLGGGSGRLVRVHGTITGGGKPVHGCMVSAHRSNAESYNTRSPVTDEHGRYELFVDGPGEYTFRYQRRRSSTHSSEKVTIPEVLAFEHGFRFPETSISGRVLTDRGEPEPSVRVSLHPVFDQPEARESSSSNASGFTDPKGAFLFDGLIPGNYHLEAGDPPGQAAGRGQRSVPDIVVEEGRPIRDLEIRLPPTCRIEGRVTWSDGSPFSGASIHACGEDGASIPLWRGPRSDSSGHFSVEGLPAGKLTLSARTGRLASVASASVTVGARETARVALVMGAGTRLRVDLERTGGSVEEARIEVRDELGCEVAGWYFREGDTGAGSEALAPGLYTIRAMGLGNLEGILATREVRLDGQAEEVVVLKLDR